MDTHYGNLDTGNRETGNSPLGQCQGPEKPGNSLRPTTKTSRRTAGPDASRRAVCVVQNTRCSVSRVPMRAEIAKCLISLTSLIPVMVITGNSGSLDVDSFGGLAGIEPRTRRSGHVRDPAALAGFRTVNLTAKSIFALSP